MSQVYPELFDFALDYRLYPNGELESTVQAAGLKPEEFKNLFSPTLFYREVDRPGESILSEFVTPSLLDASFRSNFLTWVKPVIKAFQKLASKQVTVYYQALEKDAVQIAGLWGGFYLNTQVIYIQDFGGRGMFTTQKLNLIFQTPLMSWDFEWTVDQEELVSHYGKAAEGKNLIIDSVTAAVFEAFGQAIPAGLDDLLEIFNHSILI
jgi:hypothetical protein